MKRDTSMEFAGTERFEVVSRLGSGGMGVVYETIDRENGRRVALKTLSMSDATSIYRFKKEFRGLVDISHPNLVSLYEFVGASTHWFFTMELIDGTHLLDYLRHRAPDMSFAVTEDLGKSAERRAANQSEVAAAGPSVYPVPLSPPRNMRQVRDTMRQLAEGIHALHCSGKLHRDIKPNNILVTKADDRVVLLDFGLSSDYGEYDRLTEDAIVGTLAYMSPEQGGQKTLTPASDWYSMGTLLYEILCGGLPYSGKSEQILARKQREDAVDLREHLPDLPDDLCDLCMALLNRDASKRPAGPDILQLLGAASNSRVSGSHLGRHKSFVGRVNELAELQRAFSQVQRQSAPQCVLLPGSPGVGKTRLLEHFCQKMADEHRAIILSGRCYERESLPFKAVDTIVDSLCRYLSGLSTATVRGLLPEYCGELVRLFPVFRTVRAIGQRFAEQQVLDPLEIRRRGVAGLRSLLAAIGNQNGLILRIDDFQWGDSDSADLLAGFLGLPDPPKLLLCLSYRDEDALSSHALQALHKQRENMALGQSVTEIPVGPLSVQETRKLTLERFGVAVHAGVLDHLITESEGNPFFVEEMVRHLRTSVSADLEVAQSGSLRAAILARLDSLTQSQRVFLDVLALAGSPIAERVVMHACQFAGEDEIAESKIVSVLRVHRLLRSNRGSDTKLESYHDRIREVLVDALPAARKTELYRRLGAAYVIECPKDHGTIADFYSRSGDIETAAIHAHQAAEQCMDKLAFKRAAYYYSMALRANGGDSPGQLHMRHAEALSNAGLGVEAANSYLLASEQAEWMVALNMRRLAADNLVRAGQIDRATELFASVLAEVGVQYPKTTQRALAGLLWHRGVLWKRGIADKPHRHFGELSPKALLKMDILYSCAVGFGMNHPIRGADMQTRYLLLALQSGDSGHIGKGVALEAMYRTLGGKESRHLVRRLIKIARSNSQDPIVEAYASSARALMHYQCGSWQLALENFDSTAEKFWACTGLQSVACQAERMAVDSLFNLGEMGELAKRVPNILRAAQDRGDQHGVTDMQTGLPNSSWLVRDQVDRARAECVKGEELWSERTFYLQHYYAALANIQIALYEGQGDRALAQLQGMWPKLKRSMLLRVPAVRTEAYSLKARVLLLVASQVTGQERAKYLRRVEKAAAVLARQLATGAQAQSNAVWAQVACLRQQEAATVTFLNRAVEGFSSAGMQLHLHACRGMLANLLSHDDATDLQTQIQHWASRQSIVRPDRLLRVVLPVSSPG